MMTVNKDVFHAIADPTRRAILVLISFQSMTPNGLAKHFETSRQAVSKHIQVLAECELVKQEQSGREKYYQVNAAKMKEIQDWLDPFRQLWDTRFNQLDNVLKDLKNKKS